MTPEEWLASKTGYCSRLHARITPKQCEANRDTQLFISCSGCGGLDMENKFKGNHKPCVIPGCEKQAWKQGMCYHHFHQQAKMNQNEPKTSQTAPNEPEELTPHQAAESSTAGLPALLPIIDGEKHGFFLDFGERLTELRILEKNGVTPGQIVDMLCMVAGGGYELRKVG